jgi:hypothetical protein
MAQARRSGGKGSDDDRQRDGVEDPTRDPLPHPRRDEQLEAGGEPGSKGQDSEGDGADGEDRARPVSVVEPAGGKQGGRQRKEEAGRHPCQLANAAIEVARDVRQRQADDAGVDEGKAGQPREDQLQSGIAVAERHRPTIAPG